MTEDHDFDERPRLNERENALNYIEKLISEASIDSRNRQEDIRSLMDIQQLLNQKRYGLVWEEHEEKVDEKLKHHIPVFVEEKKKKIHGNYDTNIFNFLLVGDNLHSLHLLEKTHTGKVNVICIDPPYNTGNKDFKYNDSFIDSSDSFIHSKWISFMYRRLILAKDLLTDDGIVLINIGNNEYANLKLLMDQVFLNGYVTTLHVEMSTVQGMKVKSAKQGNIVKNGEYVLVYSKDGHKNVMKNPLYDLREYDSHYTKFLTKNDELLNLRNVFQDKYPNEEWTDVGDLFKSNRKFKKFVENNVDHICRIDKTTGFDKNDFKEDTVYHQSKNGRNYLLIRQGDKVNQLMLLNASWGKTDGFRPKSGFRKIRGDWWPGFYLDMGNINKEGGVKLSNGKKPLRLIKQLLKATTDKNDIILDFFAGSGTTGQAVVDLNRDDGGHRSFILATNNEGKIAEQITYQRMLNVNNGYTNYDANPLNLKYYKTAFISKDSENLEAELLKNVKTLIELQYGLDFENSKFAMVIKRSQVSKLTLQNITTVFMRGRVHRMMTPSEQERYHIENVNIIDIPEKFFGRELQGWL